MDRSGRLSLFAGVCAAVLFSQGASAQSWKSWGPNDSNTRYVPGAGSLGVDRVSTLHEKWVVELGSDQASANPVVEGDAVYMTDFSGALTRFDRATGAVVWTKQISDYTGAPADVARVSPAIAGELLILGDQGGRACLAAQYYTQAPPSVIAQACAGTRVIAVDKHTGDGVWVTTVSQHPASVVTQSATVHGDRVYVGVSSIEEFFSAGPQYPCCSFAGSMVALDVATGDIVWQTSTVDSAAYIKGFRGNAVWGSQPAIDAKRASLYIATGNNYEAPQSVKDCVREVMDTDPLNEARVRACVEGDGNYFDAVVAFDLHDGHVKWANSTLPFDAYTIACAVGVTENCPSPAGPDHDFGQAPMLFKPKGCAHKELLAVAQKSGMTRALNPDDGTEVWEIRTGPGGHLGGSMWGSATDGDLVYVTESNSRAVPWTLQGYGPSAGEIVTSGYWSAVDACSGEIAWQTPTPNGETVMAPVTVAGDVLFAASLAPDPAPNLFALEAASGEILWSYASGASVVGGASVAGGTVYWASGYSGGELAVGVSTQARLYAFDTKPRACSQ